MQINISGHHVEVTQALKDYVHSKVEKLERHFDNITNVQVTLTVENHTQKAEATMHAAGAELHANADDDNMYAAIDGLADKLDRQLIKHKEKTTSHRNGSTH
ncbi:MAG: putative sigma-54 modulation protein [Bermanella sp.]|jgi:putative sigma-54 modulation protein